MDMLVQLLPVTSELANSQAREILDLFSKAVQQGHREVFFHAVEIHPLVQHTLTSKGYIVEDITMKIGFVTPTIVKKYRIRV
jgi:hypothetical protein